ncbi:hypothetical protein U1Q18_052573 [Sarracenia purpurea var. burkii]
MTVADYEAEFTNLAEYAPHMISTENMKARKFEDGLRPEIRRVIRPMRLPTYAEVIDRALLVEQDQEESRKFLASRKRPNPNNEPYDGGVEKKIRNDQVRGDDNQTEQLCGTCGKRHTGTCWRLTNGCWSCGSKEHHRRDCPRLQGKNKNVDQSPNQGNFDRMNQKKLGIPNGNQQNNQKQGKVYALIPGDPRNQEDDTPGMNFSSKVTNRI